MPAIILRPTFPDRREASSLRSVLELEDRIDGEAAMKALNEFEASGEKSIPYADVKRRLDAARQAYDVVSTWPEWKFAGLGGKPEDWTVAGDTSTMDVTVAEGEQE